MIAGTLFLALLQGAVDVPDTVAPAATAAPAASAVIAVILPNAPDASMLEALKRLRGEAESVGLEMRLLRAESFLDPRAQLTRVARELDAAAAVALVGMDSAPSAGSSSASRPAAAALRSMDVWYLDPTTGETSLGHLTVEEEAGARADVVLAIRVVDFIRARMFDSLVRSMAKPKPKHATAAIGSDGSHYIGAGLATTGSFSGFDAAFLPTLDLGYAMRPWCRLMLSLAGLGTKVHSELSNVGSVSMDQKIVQASAVFMGGPWWRVEPFVAAGVTAYFLSVRGVGYSGYIGDRLSTWSPGLHSTAGFMFAITSHVAVQADGGALLLGWQPRAYVGDTEVARTGRPAWLGRALLAVSF